jgi:pimeloyl-ACP methyl ester carboxylesterase
MLQEHTFPTQVVTLNYAEGPPAGPPLVLLHGGSGYWQHFTPIIPHLAKRTHLFALDLRGHGQSGWVPGRYRLRDYADDIGRFLEQRLTQPAILFGHSLGGIVALLVAAQQPARVRAVIVGDSPLTADTWHDVLTRDRPVLVAWRDLAGDMQPIDAAAEALKDAPIGFPEHSTTLVPMREVFGEDSPIYRELATRLHQQDPDVLGLLLDDFDAAATGYDMDRVLPAISCPVCLLQADPTVGRVMTDAEVARALPLLTQPRHVRLAGVSHMLHAEQPHTVLREVIDFLSTLSLSHP